MRKLAVINAARALVRKLDLVHQDPLYKSVWFCAFNHGIDYTDGPKYEKELSELRKALGL
jgi:hypothetical protein